MLNLAQNPSFDELVSGVDKLLIYMLDSTAKSSRSYTTIVDHYLKEGYEEYAVSQGKILDMAILGKEGNDNRFTGYIAREDVCLSFYLKGDIQWEKIPSLLQQVKEEDFLITLLRN